MRKKDWIIVIMISLTAFIVTYVGSSMLLNSNNKTSTEIKKSKTNANDSFTIKFIKEANSYNKSNNYIVSPYSVEVALSMLKEGSSGNTKKQLNKLIKKDKTGLDNKSIKQANVLFIKDKYKDVIKEDFTNSLKSKYNSELLVDSFKTPDVINNWVKEKTDGMIPKIINGVDENFILGIANALSIDTKWKDQFECDGTKKDKFIVGKKKIDVEMMNKTYEDNVEYINGNVKGILLPYEDDLEFIGIMPKKDLNKFISNLDDKSLNKYLNSFKKLKKKQELDLSLPRFSYDYDFDKFKKSLKKLGMKDAFDKDDADFTKIVDKEDLKKVDEEAYNIYVNDAIHKAKIELNEEGTKAAAVTYFGMDVAITSVNDSKLITIKFNKPFMYIIRDKKSKEIVFFGTVYKPNKWKGSTCTEEN